MLRNKLIRPRRSRRVSRSAILMLGLLLTCLIPVAATATTECTMAGIASVWADIYGQVWICENGNNYKCAWLSGPTVEINRIFSLAIAAKLSGKTLRIRYGWDFPCPLTTDRGDVAGVYLVDQ